MTVQFERVIALSNIVPGTQDFVNANFLGATPQAAIIFSTFSAPLGTRVVHGRFSFGACDATRQFVAAGNTMEDNVSPTETKRSITNTDVIRHLLPSGSGNDGIAIFDSFIPNGIRLDWTTAPSSAVSVLILLVFTADGAVHVDSEDLTNVQDLEIDVTSPGFEPTVVFHLSGAENHDVHLTKNKFVGSFGVSANGGSQHCTNWLFNDNKVDGEPDMSQLSNRVGGEEDKYTVEVLNYDASGFSYFARDGGGKNHKFVFLAIDTGAPPNSLVDVFEIDTPTVTGSFAKTGIGFVPGFILLCQTLLETRDVWTPDDPRSGSLGFGVASILGEEAALNVTDEQAAASSNTSSLSNALRTAVLAQDDQAAGLEADHISMDVDGFSLDFTTVLGSVRRWWGVAIEGAVITDGSLRVSNAFFVTPDARIGGQLDVSQAKLETPNPVDNADGENTIVTFVKCRTFNEELLRQQLALEGLEPINIFFDGFSMDADGIFLQASLGQATEGLDADQVNPECTLRMEFAFTPTQEQLDRIFFILCFVEHQKKSDVQQETDQADEDLVAIQGFFEQGICDNLTEDEKCDLLRRLARVVLFFHGSAVSSDPALELVLVQFEIPDP